MRVVVAGAGLGGLCVAHGLRRAGADVEVLEAGAGIGDFGQGYRINVNAAGHGALRACLDDERFRAYEASLHRQSDPAVYLYSPALELLSRSQLAAAPGAVDRGTLRRLLADGLGDRVRFGRAVTSVASVASVASTGGADLIVAADGAGSALRRELLPEAGPRDLGLSAIFGRSPLTDANRGWTAPAILNSRFCGLVDGATVLALGAYDPADVPASRATTEPYVMWVLMGPADEFPAVGTSSAGLLRFAAGRTGGWDPRAISVLREAMAADCFLTPLRSMDEIPEIPLRGAGAVPVAFLGDAIHAMSPAGGEGANTAFGDAALLVSHLRAGGPVTDAVARYHADMRISAGQALKRSANYAIKELSRV
jgi:2-polyprenyl-6-methoxyphenol hydroxylase-like FAD-dependent oxidoreductase